MLGGTGLILCQGGPAKSMREKSPDKEKKNRNDVKSRLVEQCLLGMQGMVRVIAHAKPWIDVHGKKADRDEKNQHPWKSQRGDVFHKSADWHRPMRIEKV